MNIVSLFSSGNFRIKFLINTIITIGIAVIIISFIILLFRAKEGKEQALISSTNSLHSYTYMMAEHLRQSILNADIILRSELSKNYYANFAEGNIQSLKSNFKAWLNETPSICGLAYIDERGKLRAVEKKQDSMVSFFEGDNIENFEHFAIHKENLDNLNYHISVFREYENDFKFDKTIAYIIISKRISKPDGSFGGIILASIKSSYISEFFKSLRSQDSDSKLIIFNSDLTSILNINSKYGDIKEVLKNFYNPQKELFEINKLEIINVDENNYQELVSVYKIENFGLMLSIIYPKKEIFRDWYIQLKSSVLYFSLFSLFIVISCVFLVLLLKQFYKAKESEKAAIYASQAKSDFLTNMSHELRTPLNAIIGFSDMITTGYLGQVNDKQKERISDISYCGQHLLSLINDILLFAKGEAGKIELFPEQCSIREIIDDSLRIFGEKKRMIKNVKENKIAEIVVDVQEKIPDIFVDKRKFKQVILNLVSNSAKFTPNDGIIKITAYVNKKNELFIDVSDTGIGMTEEEIKTSVTTFGQVHKDVANRGTGIGLPLSKMLIELHEGKFLIQSSKNIGTKVSIIIPNYRILWSQVKPSNMIDAS